MTAPTVSEPHAPLFTFELFACCSEWLVDRVITCRGNLKNINARALAASGLLRQP